jgi:hypothetical protein
MQRTFTFHIEPNKWKAGQSVVFEHNLVIDSKTLHKFASHSDALKYCYQRVSMIPEKCRYETRKQFGCIYFEVYEETPHVSLTDAQGVQTPRH